MQTSQNPRDEPATSPHPLGKKTFAPKRNTNRFAPNASEIHVMTSSDDCTYATTLRSELFINDGDGDYY